jgi:hypothetical protein
MNTLLAGLKRGWQAWCPQPQVGQREAFLLRAMLAFTLIHFLPAAMPQATQPVPVGLAHWFDLTWMADAEKYAAFRAAFMFCALWFTTGVWLPLSLPLLTLLHVLPYTLYNSQGHPHHGYQIMSLTLLGMSIAALVLWARGHSGVQRRSAIQSFVVLVVIAAGLRGWRAWEGSGLSAKIIKMLPVSDALIGYVVALLGLIVFVALALVMQDVMSRAKVKAAPAALLNAWLLLSAQTMMAGAYFISVITKLLRSDGAWWINSHYVALDFVKTLRQSYFSGLDPQFQREPAGVVWLMEHPHLARVFFDSGVLLEASFLLAIGSRRLALVLGVSGVCMHLSIEKLMTLSFTTHEAMLLLCFVNVPLLIAKMWPESR